MPRKRQRQKVAHRAVRWDDLFLTEMMDFWWGWHPPRDEVERQRSMAHTGALGLRSWEEFLETWLQVQDEALLEWQTHKAELLAHSRAEVARRQAEIREATLADRADYLDDLLEHTEEGLAEEEAEEWPFAEIVLRRVQAGEPPEGDDSDD
jgi:hypothetical protein